MSRTYRRTKQVSTAQWRYWNIKREMDHQYHVYRFDDRGVLRCFLQPPMTDEERAEKLRHYHSDRAHSYHGPTGSDWANQLERRRGKKEIHDYMLDPENVEVICGRIKNNPWWYWL